MASYSPSVLEDKGDMHRETLSQKEWEETTISTVNGAVVLRLIENALHIGVTCCPMPDDPPEVMLHLTILQTEALRDELSALLEGERICDDV